MARGEFALRFRAPFSDPAFEPAKDAISYEPYATSHETLDRDEALHEEARNVGRLVAHAVRELRAGRLQAARPRLPQPRPK